MAFLKSGVNIEGSAEDVIEETRETTVADMKELVRRGNFQASQMKKQGRMNFFKSIVKGASLVAGG